MCDRCSGRTAEPLLGPTPGHLEWGNEEADKLARRGAAIELLGPEPVVGLPLTSVKKKVQYYMSQEQRRRWSVKPGLRQLRAQIAGESAITGLLTGHNALG